MELVFSECNYGEDFESVEYVPEGWPVGEDAFIWFKAYDTSFCETERETELHDAGFEFDCLVWLEHRCMGPRDYLMESTGARNKQEAERLLQVAADALYR